MPNSLTPVPLKSQVNPPKSIKESQIPGFKTLLLGGTGAGKTYSLWSPGRARIQSPHLVH